MVGVTCIGGFIGQLDASIVQLALPRLEREFGANLDAVSWVAIAYLLAFASALPIFARLSETKGRKLLYLAGYALFTLASALCGMVSDLRLLIAFRAIHGVGGALLGANSITILVKAAGPSRLGRAMGLYAAAQAVGISIGPVIGGLILTTLGWRWISWEFCEALHEPHYQTLPCLVGRAKHLPALRRRPKPKNGRLLAVRSG